MIATGSIRSLWPAGAVALALHGILLVGFRAAPSPSAEFMRPPPRTIRLPQPTAGAEAVDARRVWSPLLFALPSEYGFSRVLLDEQAQTRLLMPELRVVESFLEVGPVWDSATPQVLRELVFALDRPRVPAVPRAEIHRNADFSAPRAYIGAPLGRRLEGNTALPSALNEEGAEWEVHASVSVSPEGVVRHVMLEKPVVSEPLNRAVLQWLYNLRFTPGEAMDGQIELYSAGPAPLAEAE